MVGKIKRLGIDFDKTGLDRTKFGGTTIPLCVDDVGARGDGESDDTEFFLEAVDTGRPVMLSEKSYLVDDLTFDFGKPTALFGRRDSSKIILANAGSQIVHNGGEITLGNVNTFMMEGVTIVRAVGNTSSGMLDISFDNAVLPAGEGTQSTVLLQDVSFVGADNNTNVATALHLTNTQNAHLNRIRTHGSFTDIGGTGILIDGDGAPIDIAINDFYSVFMNRAADIQAVSADYGAEGITFNAPTIVFGNYGIRAESTAFNPYVGIFDANINTYINGVYLKNYAWATIKDSLFYIADRGNPGQSWTGIETLNTNGADPLNFMNAIAGNRFIGYTSANHTTRKGIVIGQTGTSRTDTLIDANIFESLTADQTWGSGTTNITSTDTNVSRNATAQVVNNSGNLTNIDAGYATVGAIDVRTFNDGTRAFKGRYTGQIDGFGNLVFSVPEYTSVVGGTAVDGALVSSRTDTRIVFRRDLSETTTLSFYVPYGVSLTDYTVEYEVTVR